MRSRSIYTKQQTYTAFSPPGSKILEVNTRSFGLDHKPHDKCISWANLGSVLPTDSVSPSSTTALSLVMSVWNGDEPSYFWALLDISWETYRPLLWFLRMRKLFCVKGVRHLRWDESAFISRRGEENLSFKTPLPGARRAKCVSTAAAAVQAGPSID